jgi:hypothetical protein
MIIINRIFIASIIINFGYQLKVFNEVERSAWLGVACHAIVHTAIYVYGYPI